MSIDGMFRLLCHAEIWKAEINIKAAELERTLEAHQKEQLHHSMDQMHAQLEQSQQLMVEIASDTDSDKEMSEVRVRGYPHVK